MQSDAYCIIGTQSVVCLYLFALAHFDCFETKDTFRGLRTTSINSRFRTLCRVVKADTKLGMHRSEVTATLNYKNINLSFVTPVSYSHPILAVVAVEVIYLRGLLKEMGREEVQATPMYVDNSGAVELSKDRRSYQRSRHVDRRDLKVREYVAHGCIE
eukprot:6176828-Pleurochrysis_carterae.AAC.1